MESVSRRELLTFDVPASGPAADHWIRVKRHAMACRFEILLSGLAVVLAFIWVSVSEGRARERGGLR